MPAELDVSPVEDCCAAWLQPWLLRLDEGEWQPGSPERCLREYREDHADLPMIDAMRAGLERRFETVWTADSPALAHGYLDRHPAAEDEEVELVTCSPPAGRRLPLRGPTA